MARRIFELTKKERDKVYRALWMLIDECEATQRKNKKYLKSLRNLKERFSPKHG